MIVKEVLNEDLITLAEIKDIFLTIKDHRTEQDMELGYELRRAINHADSFAKTDVQTSSKIIEELLKLEKMKPEIAYRLADIMPSSFDEIRSIYAKERFSLDEKELIQILDIITDTH
ncbi:MAG: RNA polymerase Rpb4 family protein [Methanosarcinales archaeon]